jgi:tetratricopeptide (TPR) repeat protein
MRIRFAPEPEVQRWDDRAQKEAAAALALDPNLAEAHEARAAVARNNEFDWDLAINESDRALALNPSLEMPHFYRAAAFYHFGLLDRARAEIRLGMENNPVSGNEPFRLLGTTALLGGQFAEAESALRTAQGLTISESASTYLAQALYNLGKKTEAEEILSAVARSKSAQARRRAQAILASYLAARNEHVKARALITDVLAGTYVDHHVAYGLGVAFAQVGDLAEARRWLTRAAAQGFPVTRGTTAIRRCSRSNPIQLSRIHEAAEQPVRRESCPLWLTKTADHFTTRTSKSPCLRRTVTLTSSGCRSNSRSTVPSERSTFSSRSE